MQSQQRNQSVVAHGRSRHTKSVQQTKDSKAIPPKGKTCESWSNTMGSHYLNIFTAWTLATIPILLLAVVFLIVVEHSRLKATPGSFYSDGQQVNISLGSAVYSSIPSTQLTFVASFSSTLATALLPAVMALYSYVSALAITRDSDTDDADRLPSPYQLELLITGLNGSILALWSFATYRLSYKQKRVPVTPNLWRALSMLGTMTALAYGRVLSYLTDNYADLHRLLIAMTDAWLNFVSHSRSGSWL